MSLRANFASSMDSRAEALKFKSLAGEIEHCVANGSPPSRCHSERSYVPERNDAENFNLSTVAIDLCFVI